MLIILCFIVSYCTVFLLKGITNVSYHKRTWKQHEVKFAFIHKPWSISGQHEYKNNPISQSVLLVGDLTWPAGCTSIKMWYQESSQTILLKAWEGRVLFQRLDTCNCRCQRWLERGEHCPPFIFHLGFSGLPGCCNHMKFPTLLAGGDTLCPR